MPRKNSLHHRLAEPRAEIIKIHIEITGPRIIGASLVTRIRQFDKGVVFTQRDRARLRCDVADQRARMARM